MMCRLVLSDAVAETVADDAPVIVVGLAVALERAGEVGVLTVHGRIGQTSVKQHLAELGTGHGCRWIAASGGVNAVDL